MKDQMDSSEQPEIISYRVIHSSRRTMAISILPDASVIVRVPYHTSEKRIQKLISDKSAWILKHTNNFRVENQKRSISYTDGSLHPLRGSDIKLIIEKSSKSFYRIGEGTITIGLNNPDDQKMVKSILYGIYKDQANRVFPLLTDGILKRFDSYGFKPRELVIRTMKRRWGSCSNKGKITLNTELIKLSERYIEYVIIHELCHLRHHNHGEGFYSLLEELFPDWKNARKEMKRFVIV
jgi:predicted metal-dependent hydrolase